MSKFDSGSIHAPCLTAGQTVTISPLKGTCLPPASTRKHKTVAGPAIGCWSPGCEPTKNSAVKLLSTTSPPESNGGHALWLRQKSAGHLGALQGTSTALSSLLLVPGKPDVGPGACCARKLRGCCTSTSGGGVLYDLAVSRRVCGSVDADGKIYAASAAKRRTSLCCSMEVVCFIFCAGPSTASCTDQR